MDHVRELYETVGAGEQRLKIRKGIRREGLYYDE